jgi:hypothetical protein
MVLWSWHGGRRNFWGVLMVDWHPRSTFNFTGETDVDGGRRAIRVTRRRFGPVVFEYLRAPRA